jgi:septum site-determining protein MinC
MSNHLTAPQAPELSVRMDGKVPVLMVPEDLRFEPLRAWFRERLPDVRDELGGRSCRLDYGVRRIVLFDLRRIIHMLREEFTIDVTGLYARDYSVVQFAERELKLKLFVTQDTEPEPILEPEPMLDLEIPADEPAVDDVPLAAPEPEPQLEVEVVVEEEPQPAPPQLRAQAEPNDGSRRTLPLYRTLRSGTRVRFDGDVTVFGDVNPGAQIEAAGNVVILGALKGMVHAGATGNERAFVMSFDLRPTQVRIGRKIAIPPEQAPNERIFEPQIATVFDGQIVIEPYRGPLPR